MERKPLFDDVSRRSVLKAAGGTFMAAGSLVGITSARKKERELAELKQNIKAANQIARKQGPEARKEHLNNNGIETSYVRGSLPNPDPEYQKKKREAQEDDDINTEKVGCVSPSSCDGDIDVTLSISYSRYESYYTISSTMRLRYYYNCVGSICGVSNGGEAPPDGTSFTWPKGDLKVTDRQDIQNSIHSGPHQWWQNGSWNRQGLTINTNDRKMCTEATHDTRGDQWTPYETCSIYLEPASGFSGDESVHALYTHSWNFGEISISASYPWGISVSYGGTNAKSKTFQTTLSEKNLYVTI